MADKRHVGVVGLGRMGLPIGRALIDAGYRVHGYRRGGMAEFTAAGGIAAGAPRDLAQACSVVITCLPSAEALETVLFGPSGIFAGDDRAVTIIDMSTLPLDVKHAAARRCRQAGGHMLDCPLSGIPTSIAERRLAIFASGDRPIYDRHSALFEAITPRHIYAGAFGQGTKLKFIANLLVGVHSLAAAEAVALGTRCGLEPATLMDAINAGAGTSAMFQIRAPMMRSRRYRPAPGPLESLARQLEWIQAFAHDSGVPTPLLDTSLDWFARSIAQGWGDADQAALYETLLSAADGDG